MFDDPTSFFFPVSGATSLPLLFEPEVLRCTACGPGGRPLRVLIDTGTDPSAIDLRLARRLGLTIGDFALGRDATSDSVPFAETLLPWLRLGDLTLRDLYLLAVDLSASPFEVDLVLGYNVLPYLTLTVDYRKQMLHLCHPDLAVAAPSPNGAAIPLTFFEHFPALAGLRLDGVELPLVTIDTGSNGCLTLGTDLADRLGLRPGAAHVEVASGAGFASSAQVLRSAAHGLQLGPFTLNDIAIDTPSASSGDLSRAGRANLGNRLLARFASFTLDYERRLCIFEPYQE